MAFQYFDYRVEKLLRTPVYSLTVFCNGQRCDKCTSVTRVTSISVPVFKKLDSIVNQQRKHIKDFRKSGKGRRTSATFTKPLDHIWI